VADSRHSTPEKIDAIAQGRVWTGRQAKQNGLVDQLGGLDVAIGAWVSANLSKGEIEALRTLRSPFDMFRRGEPLALMPFEFLR
ncbi:MAG TPA: S49 family peptidase, partial [Vicinamibacterales bacterium]